MITVYKAVRGEYTEKKSRFIASLKYVASENEAEEFIASIKKEFYDARHNCSAYIITAEDGRVIKKSSDDGEPQGTAGHPMLDVLENQGIVNIAAVVTRYFGGTLLGTGGLVRSYTKALQDALEKSTLIERKRGSELLIKTDYSMSGKLEYYLAGNNLAVSEKNYTENVEFKVIVPEESYDRVVKDINAMTSGRCVPELIKAVDFAVLGNEVLTGDRLVNEEKEIDLRYVSVKDK